MRHPVAPVRVLLRAQPALVAPLRAAGGDPGLPGGASRRRWTCARRPTCARRASTDARWTLETSAGPFTADVLITACGQLSTPSVPPIAGLDAFAGPAFHTARWRHDVDLARPPRGRDRDGLQRDPGRARDRRRAPPRSTVYHARRAGRSRSSTSPTRRAPSALRALPAAAEARPRLDLRLPRLLRARHDACRWLLNRLRGAGRADPARDPRPRAAAQAHAARRDRLQADDAHRRLVSDADRARTSTRHRRIERVTAGGVPADGRERPADVLVLATGFASHAFVAPLEIVGRDGRTLAEAWGDVPRAYLGVTVPDFPNLFLLYGPNTNGGTGSVIATIEASMTHVLAALAELRRAGATTIEVRPRRRRRLRRHPARRPRRHRLALAAARTGTSTSTATTRRSGPGPGRSTAAAPRARPGRLRDFLKGSDPFRKRLPDGEVSRAAGGRRSRRRARCQAGCRSRRRSSRGKLGIFDAPPNIRRAVVSLLAVGSFGFVAGQANRIDRNRLHRRSDHRRTRRRGARTENLQADRAMDLPLAQSASVTADPRHVAPAAEAGGRGADRRGHQGLQRTHESRYAADDSGHRDAAAGTSARTGCSNCSRGRRGGIANCSSKPDLADFDVRIA